MSLTVIEIANEVFPPELVAVTVYVAVDVTAVGVPEMTPVEVFSESPFGNAGDTLYETTFPVTDGVRLAIAVPRVNTFGDA